MNFIFTEDQIQFKEAIKSFLTDECTPESIRLRKIILSESDRKRSK